MTLDELRAPRPALPDDILRGALAAYDEEQTIDPAITNADYSKQSSLRGLSDGIATGVGGDGDGRSKSSGFVRFSALANEADDIGEQIKPSGKFLSFAEIASGFEEEAPVAKQKQPSLLDRAKSSVNWNAGRDFKVPEGQTVTDDSFSAGVPGIQNEKPKRNILMENSIMRNSNGTPATEQTAYLSSLPSVQKIGTPSLQFERQKESNRKWLDNSKPLVVDQLMRDNNLSAEDAEIEFSRMRNAGVVPKATESGLREATWGEAFDSGIAKVKPSFDKSMAGLASIKSDVTGDFALSSMADALRQEANRQIAEVDGILAGTSKDSWKKTISDAPASLAQNLPTVIAASALASNPLLAGVIGNIGLAGMGMMSGGAAYAEGKDSGLNVSNNLQQSGLKALAEVIPEKMSLNVLVGALGKKAAEQAMKDSILQSAKTLGKYFGAEIGTEELTTIAQFGIDKMYSKPDLTMKELVGQMIDTAKGTLIQAPILGGTGILTKAAVDTAGRIVDPTGYQLRGWADAVDRTNFTPMQGGAENFDGYDQRMADVAANPFGPRLTRITQAEQTKQAAQAAIATAPTVDAVVEAFNVANAAGSASIVDQSALLNELTGSTGLDASIATADADAQSLQAGIRDIDQQPTTLGERVSESGIPMGVANAPQISTAPAQANPTSLPVQGIDPQSAPVQQAAAVPGVAAKADAARVTKSEEIIGENNDIKRQIYSSDQAPGDGLRVLQYPDGRRFVQTVDIDPKKRGNGIGQSLYKAALADGDLEIRPQFMSEDAKRVYSALVNKGEAHVVEHDGKQYLSAAIQPSAQTTQQQGSTAAGAIQQNPSQQSIVKSANTGLAAQDNLKGAIMRVTGNQGIAANMAQTITGDKAGSANPRLRGLFLNGGTMDLGDVAELLRVQENYDVRDGDHLSELLREVAGGDQVYSIDRMERDAAVNAEKQYKSEVNRKAEELGLKKIGGKRTLAMVEADIARVEQERADMEARAERAAIQAESVYDELMGSDMSGADWLNWMSRSFKYTQEEIDYVSAIQANREDARTEADALYDSKEQAQGNLGERQEDGDAQAREGGTAEERLSTKRSEFRLEGQTNEQASEQKKESELTKEQIDRERDGTPFTLEQESQPKPMGTQGSLFARQITADDKATLTNVADADLPANVKQTAAFLRVMSRILGKKIQWVSGANFDGMVKDSDTIYLNVSGDTSKIAVFGHEFWHQVEMTHKAIFDAVLNVVDPMFDLKQATRMFNDYYSKNASEAEVSAWLKEKNEQLSAQQGKPMTNRDFLIREFLSDTTGNRFTESDFWGDVFAKLEQREGHLKAVTLIRKFVKSLTDALNKLTNVLKLQGFRTDNDLTAEQIGQVKLALSEGMAQYLQDTRYGTKAKGTVASGAKYSTQKDNAFRNSPEADKEFSDTERAYGGHDAHTRAVESGKTKLNYRQWVQVRTPKFKAWFGDWESLLRQSQTRKLIDRALSDPTWQQRTLIADGGNADPSGKLSEVFGFRVRRQYLTPDDIRKSDKRHGAGKEQDSDQIGLSHDDYVKAIEVLRNPETFKSTVSNNGKPSAEFGRRFEDGTLVVAEVETSDRGGISIKSVWKKVPGRNHAGAVPYPIRTPEDTAGVDLSIHSDSLIVNPDSVSKVIDPQTGEPLVVYHGTPYDFGKDDKPVAFRDDRATMISPSPNVASKFAFYGDANVMAMFANIKRPHYTENQDDAEGVSYWMTGEELRNGDYDGLIYSKKGNILKGASGWGDDIPQYAVFSPEQLKSATGNNGEFSSENKDVRYSPQRRFYSQLERTVEQTPDRIFATAPQFKMWLLANAGKFGIKKEEIQWTGITEWLDLQGKGKVSKADVLGYLAQNGVQVQEVEKGEGDWAVYDGEQNKYFTSRKEAEDYASSNGINITEDTVFRGTNRVGGYGTKYSNYVLPGATNYRELLLTLPAKKAWDVRLAEGKYRLWNEATKDWGRTSQGKLMAGYDTKESADRAARMLPEGSAGNYRSNHWEEANILAHIRFNERVDADGAKVLFIEEIQSDYAQDKRKGKDVPAAPFIDKTEAWTALAVKRMIAYAVENGYDKVAFVNGQQSADRYDLSKQVGEVLWNQDNGGHFVANKASGAELINKKGVKESDLEELIGKDVAEKLSNATPQGNGYRRLRGLDLKVGGEGMIKFYDQIIPQVVSDVLKKVGGGKVESVRFNDFESKDGASDDKLLADLGVEVKGSRPVGQPGFTVTESMKAKVSEGMPLFSRQRTQSPPEETKAQLAQRKAQDKLNRFTVIKDWLKEQGVALSEQADVYKAEERMHSRFANKVEDFRTKLVEPLIKKIQAAGFSMDDVSLFLHAQHAEERNNQIAKINPKQPDGGSGMSTADANNVLAAADPALVRLANEFRQITEMTKQTLLDSGIVSQEMVDAWEGAYSNYIPLKGGPDEKASKTGTGKGLHVNGKMKRALGHGKREGGEWIVENILADYERAVMLAEKNRVGHHLVKMALEVGRDDLITIGKPEKRAVLRNDSAYEVRKNGAVIGVFNSQEAARVFKTTQGGTGITITKTNDPSVIYSASPMLQDNEANVYINGHAVRVQINDDLLARAYKNLGSEAMPEILKAGRMLNNYLSKAYTGYNPEFILTNIVRDFTTGLINVTGEEGAVFAAKSAGNYLQSFGQMLKYAVTGQESRWIKDYRADGGNTGAAYLSDLERLGKEVQTEYATYKGVLESLKAKDGMGAARAAGRHAFNWSLKWIEHLNQAGENAMRLAIYRTAIESGKTRAEAAGLSKNSTVNFNRKGEWGQNVNALYLFFNAGVQGTASLAHAHFKGEHKYQAWALSSAMVGLGYAVAAAFGGGDEDDYDRELSDYDKSRNLVIRAGDSWVKIPVPYGYGFFYNLGRHFADSDRKGEWGKMPWHLASDFVGEFTPFGGVVAGKEADSKQLVFALPTAAQIPGAVAVNRTGMGSSIFPENPFDKNMPDNLKMWRNTKGSLSDDLAQTLTGVGLEVSPETLKHLGRTATGGSGAFIWSVFEAGDLKMKGADLEVKEMPFVRKFVKEGSVSDYRSAFYEARSEASKAADDFARAKKMGDMMSAQRMAKDNAELIAMDKYADSLSKMIKAKRDAQDAIKNDERFTVAEKRLKLKVMEAEEKKVYDRYLDIFKKRTDQRRERLDKAA